MQARYIDRWRPSQVSVNIVNTATNSDGKVDGINGEIGIDIDMLDGDGEGRQTPPCPYPPPRSPVAAGHEEDKSLSASANIELVAPLSRSGSRPHSVASNPSRTSSKRSSPSSRAKCKRSKASNRSHPSNRSRPSNRSNPSKPSNSSSPSSPFSSSKRPRPSNSSHSNPIARSNASSSTAQVIRQPSIPATATKTIITNLKAELDAARSAADTQRRMANDAHATNAATQAAYRVLVGHNIELERVVGRLEAEVKKLAGDGVGKGNSKKGKSKEGSCCAALRARVQRLEEECAVLGLVTESSDDSSTHPMPPLLGIPDWPFPEASTSANQHDTLESEPVREATVSEQAPGSSVPPQEPPQLPANFGPPYTQLTQILSQSSRASDRDAEGEEDTGLYTEFPYFDSDKLSRVAGFIGPLGTPTPEAEPDPVPGAYPATPVLPPPVPATPTEATAPIAPTAPTAPATKVRYRGPSKKWRTKSVASTRSSVHWTWFKRPKGKKANVDVKPAGRKVKLEDDIDNFNPDLSPRAIARQRARWRGYALEPIPLTKPDSPPRGTQVQNGVRRSMRERKPIVADLFPPLKFPSSSSSSRSVSVPRVQGFQTSKKYPRLGPKGV